MAQKELHLGVTAALDGSLEGLLPVFEAALSLGYEVSVLAVGTQAMQQRVMTLQESYPTQLNILEATSLHRERIDRRADVLLSPTLPDDSLLQRCKRYHTVLLCPAGGPVTDYDGVKETGTGFTYDPSNSWTAVRALIRAAETHHFPYDWQSLQDRLAELLQAQRTSTLMTAAVAR
ncbi:hypothetical protein H6771_02835 [Candidatus Peribacteria bacterium]|nr:hypothetical protein [Candidatus Peribacteria bacterium]